MPWLPIVGVVEDVRQWVVTPGEPTVYLASLRQPAYGFVVRAESDPSALSGSVREVVRQIDPDQPVFDVMSMERRLARSQQMTYGRFRTAVMSVFGGITLLLAAVGIYAVVRYSVAQRTQEFGIRLALGASSRAVIQLAVSESTRAVAAGGILGLALSLALARVVASLLYGASGSEPAVVALVAMLLGSIAAAAAVIPARRAGRVDPYVTLRID